MKATHATVLGFAVGLAIGVGEAVYHAERQSEDAESPLVVKWIRKNRVVETPVLTRALLVGLAFGVVGAATGRRLGESAGLGLTCIGAIVLVGLGHYVWGLMPNPHGRIGDQSRAMTLLFAAMLGAALGAEASLCVQARRRPFGEPFAGLD